MTDVIEARSKLNELANSLDRWSKALAQTSRDLEPVEAQYRKFVDDFEVGLLIRSEDEEGYRLPSAALRLKLARKAMDPALLGQYMGLVATRERLMLRLRDLRTEIESWRSILSSLKVELEATA